MDDIEGDAETIIAAYRQTQCGLVICLKVIFSENVLRLADFLIQIYLV